MIYNLKRKNRNGKNTKNAMVESLSQNLQAQIPFLVEIMSRELA
jgi:hypothetical protein